MRVGDVESEMWKDNSKELEILYHAAAVPVPVPMDIPVVFPSGQGGDQETPANDVNFSLIHDPEQDTVSSKLGILPKPYLRTSASISILQLKKYLTSKFYGNELGPQIKLMCRGQLCKDQMRVGDISTETWKDNSKDLELVYHA